jgi:hypothetical protein
MTDRVNGRTGVGEFLTGNMDFFTVATIVPVAQTNVTTPPQDLYNNNGSSTWQSVTIVDGAGTSQTYATQSTYIDAYVKQQNLDTLVKSFAGRANPVAVNVVNVTVTSSNATVTAINSGLFSFSNLNVATTKFGTATYATQVNFIRIATEKTSAWLVDTATADGNATGYQLLGTNGLEGVTVYDLQDSGSGGKFSNNNVLSGSTAQAATSSPYGSYTLYTNTVETSTGTSYNTLAQRANQLG